MSLCLSNCPSQLSFACSRETATESIGRCRPKDVVRGERRRDERAEQRDRSRRQRGVAAQEGEEATQLEEGTTNEMMN
jgi:hypothetical protein